MKIHYGIVATDEKAGMSLSDLRAFVKDTEDWDDDAVVKGSVGFRGQLQTIRVEGHA